MTGPFHQNGCATPSNGTHYKADHQQVSTGMENYSDLQVQRATAFLPRLPDVLKAAEEVALQGDKLTAFAGGVKRGHFSVVAVPLAKEQYLDLECVETHFPHLLKQPGASLQSQQQASETTGRSVRIGVVLSGGQAPGGHNVISGLLDFLTQRLPGSQLLGFLDGPKGIVSQKYKMITADTMRPFRNQGGFHMIGSGRDKIESAQDLEAAARTASTLELDGLVVIGGDDSNTNAAVLAEYFRAHGLVTNVVGVPKTIDGDLKTKDVAISFGFDTACKVYSELIGNIAIDASSAKKYYHFVRLMGRSASHITLECALQTRPQMALLSEEVQARRVGLKDITNQVADMIVERANHHKNYGVVLVPEGLIECVPEVGALIAELNDLLTSFQGEVSPTSVASALSPSSHKVFDMLPAGIQSELLLERDPHGNVQVARIETEKLLIKLVQAELSARAAIGSYTGNFNALNHYLGYEGRCSLPTNFDATYCYALGYTAGALIAEGQTGLMATISGLERPTSEWVVGGLPLPAMMQMEKRKGKLKPVIRKALVDLKGPVFQHFDAHRRRWAVEDAFRSPGPIQFAGHEQANEANLTLSLEINCGQSIKII